MSTFQHLDLCIDSLADAALQLSDANRTAGFSHWPQEFQERLDLIRRATANLRSRMVEEMGKESQQAKFEFERALEKIA